MPAWAFPGWAGEYFPDDGNALGHYARVFNTVEGNTTFYRIPEPAMVARWAEAVAGTGFRFSFKLPRSVTHQRRPDWAELDRLLKVVTPLGEHLGPFLVQCPANLGPGQLPMLEALFARLPGEYRYALELRHRAFFNEPERVEPLLARSCAGRVMFDSRPSRGVSKMRVTLCIMRSSRTTLPL